MATMYLVISLIGGILFGMMDGFINANPLATRLYAVYKPIARKSINVPAGIVIDLIFGFIMAGVFIVLYQSLPGEAGIVKGISFALGAWFFRVLMQVASQWMMFTIPARSLLYSAVAGFVEMLVLGILYGLTLNPSM